MVGHRRPRSLRSRLLIAVVAVAAIIPGVAWAATSSPGSTSSDSGHFAAFFSHAARHVAALSAGQVGVLTANPQCTLRVPANPLSAQGLATPYQLGSAGTQCSEANEGTAAFVQAVILDPATGAVSVYDPAVTDAGQPLQGSTPPVPVLPPHAVVAIWTGFNDNVLKLVGPGAGQFVNFAQQAYDNSPVFFAALRLSVHLGKTVVPPIGMASDGHACPTTRGFDLVDQDQSDNVPVSYAAYGVSNGSDQGLIDLVDKSLGCTTWTVPSLDPAISGAATSPSGLLQEEQASLDQQAPVALVPGLDDFVTNNGQAPPAGQPDLFLQDLYRLQVGQPLTFNDNDTKAYCQNLAGTGVPILAKDAVPEANSPAPQFAMIGSNLANVMAARFVATWQLLNCQALTGMPSPIQVTVDGNGVAVSGTYNGQAAASSATPTATPTATMSSAGAVLGQGTVTVYGCVSAAGSFDHVQIGTAPTCPAGETRLSWQASQG